MKKYIHTILAAIIAIISITFWVWCVKTNHLYLTGFGIIGTIISIGVAFIGYEKEITKTVNKLWEALEDTGDLRLCESCNSWCPKSEMIKMPEPQGFYVCEDCYNNQ